MKRGPTGAITVQALSAILEVGLFLVVLTNPARAEHGDWLLGTDGMLSPQQAPKGFSTRTCQASPLSRQLIDPRSRCAAYDLASINTPICAG